MAFNAGKKPASDELSATTVSRITDSPPPPIGRYGQRGTPCGAKYHLDDLSGLLFYESDEISEEDVDFNDSECIYVERAAVDNGRVIRTNHSVSSVSARATGTKGQLDGASKRSVGFGQASINRDRRALNSGQKVYPVPPTPNCSLASTPNPQGSPVLAPFTPATAKAQCSGTADMDVSPLRLDDINPGPVDINTGTPAANVAKWRAHTAGKSQSGAGMKQFNFEDLCVALQEKSTFSRSFSHGSQVAGLATGPSDKSHAAPLLSPAAPISSSNKSKPDFVPTTVNLEELRRSMNESIFSRVPVTTKTTSARIADPADGEGMTIMTMPFRAPDTTAVSSNFNPQTLELTGDAYEEELGPSWAVLTDATAIPSCAPCGDPEKAAMQTKLDNFKVAAKKKALVTAKSAFKLTRMFGGKVSSVGQEMLQDIVHNTIEARHSFGQNNHDTPRNYSSGGHAASI